MTVHNPGADRRTQIVEAACELLADLPIERLSTRRIATKLGLSQPALFRHFRSRDAILLAVVEHARFGLEQEGAALAAGGSSGLLGLTRGLFQHVEAHPALPRLLFAMSHPEDGPVHDALASLVASRRAVVRGLLVGAAARGEVASERDPGELADHFLALLQGVILGWQAAGRPPGLARRAGPMVELFLDGAAAPPRASAAPRPAPPPVPAAASLRRLDVRPLLAGGGEPLGPILEAVDGLAPGSLLVVEAPFRPSPLLGLLSGRGHAVSADAVVSGHWLVLVVVGGSPELLDLRELEAPEPLVRVLEASAALRPGEVMLARTPRLPTLALHRLHERGQSSDVQELPDGSAVLLVRAPGGP